MTFEECCMYCAGNETFVKEFSRLSGINLNIKRNPFEKAIDDACGYDPYKDGLAEFCKFVFDCVWIPLIQKQNSSKTV